MKLSLIVPAFNEEKLLGASLTEMRAAAAAFQYRGWEVELIVCDNNSTDRTAEIARAAGAIVVFEPVNQIARARNAGAGAASGDWFVFIDADTHPSAELFTDVAEQIAGGRCLAGGVTVRLDEAPWQARLGEGFWNLLSRARRWMAGSFIFVRADLFREVGGFNQAFFAAEELDLSERLKAAARKRGGRVVILNRHPVVTSGRKLKLYTPKELRRILFRSIFGYKRFVTSREAAFMWYDGRR